MGPRSDQESPVDPCDVRIQLQKIITSRLALCVDLTSQADEMALLASHCENPYQRLPLENLCEEIRLEIRDLLIRIHIDQEKFARLRLQRVA